MYHCPRTYDSSEIKIHFRFLLISCMNFIKLDPPSESMLKRTVSKHLTICKFDAFLGTDQEERGLWLRE